jgi:hypothetical protein
MIEMSEDNFMEGIIVGAIATSTEDVLISYPILGHAVKQPAVSRFDHQSPITNHQSTINNQQSNLATDACILKSPKAIAKQK